MSEAKSVDEKLAAIAKVLDQYGHALLDEPGDKLERKILTALSSFEPKPLEVEIEVNPSGDGGYCLYFPCTCEVDFNTRKEAIDWCKLHGLRIKGDKK